MNLAPEERVNMSLGALLLPPTSSYTLSRSDDLIKAKKASAKPKSAKKKLATTPQKKV
jgi:hypothetical protein